MLVQLSTHEHQKQDKYNTRFPCFVAVWHVSCLVFIVSSSCFNNAQLSVLLLPFTFGSWISLSVALFSVVVPCLVYNIPVSVVLCFTALHMQTGRIHILPLLCLYVCPSGFLLTTPPNPCPPICINLCRHHICSRQTNQR